MAVKSKSKKGGKDEKKEGHIRGKEILASRTR
jgi:hypothetical protein